MALAGLQAVASGIVIATSLRRRRWLGGAVTLVLLVALTVGAMHAAPDGLLAMAGAAHGLLYGALLWVFAATLLPGRTALATFFASRLNPTFHAGMVPYTRGVTWAWVLFFTGQLAASAVLFVAAPRVWPGFVGYGHAPFVVLMALAEAGVRRWRWRHEHSTSLADTVAGVRRMMARQDQRRS